MSNKETLLEIHEKAIARKDVEAMKVADSVMRMAIEKLAKIDDEELADLVDVYFGSLSCNNYLTEQEAISQAEKLVNKRGETGAKWSPENFFKAVHELGMKESDSTNYNKWAFWLTANMIVSDCEEVLMKWSGSDQRKFVGMAFDLAVAKLTDVDRPKFVRWYFGL